MEEEIFLRFPGLDKPNTYEFIVFVNGLGNVPHIVGYLVNIRLHFSNSVIQAHRAQSPEK